MVLLLYYYFCCVELFMNNRRRSRRRRRRRRVVYAYPYAYNNINVERKTTTQYNRTFNTIQIQYN